MNEVRTVAILYGGYPDEASISRQSAFNVANACKELDYYPTILHINSMDVRQVLEDLDNPIVLNMVHGRWGEDGSAQRMLDELGIPYFGSSSASSEITFNKAKFREVVAEVARLPKGGFVTRDEYLQWNAYPHVVKPHDSGSTVGVDYVETESGRDDVISKWGDSRKIVEEFIDGLEGATVVYDGKLIDGVIVNYNGKIFDYDTKYDPKLSSLEPWDRIPEVARKELKEMSEDVYRVCGCSGFLCIDFRLSRDNIPYVLEANSIPGMTKCSLVPYTFGRRGLSFNQVVELMLKDVSAIKLQLSASTHNKSLSGKGQ